MSDQWKSIEADLAALDKSIPDLTPEFYQRQVELRLLLSIAKSLDSLLGASVLEARL